MTPKAWQTAIIEKGELYRVGGAVRDVLFGIEHDPQDEDFLVRGIAPRTLESILRRHGRAVLVGKSFGVYKFRASGESVDHDIAFPRKEISTGPGHRDFAVEYDHRLPIEADLGRRDFTINAVAQNVADGSLVDPFRGGRDAADRVLRMIFPRAFQEDPLRILRGVRFAARFHLKIDRATYSAMLDAAPLVATISVERIQEEFNRILKQCEQPSTAFEELRRVGVLQMLLPELNEAYGIEQNIHHPDDVYWHSLKSADAAPMDNLLVRWAALLHDLGKVAAKQEIEDPEEGRKVVFYGHEDISADITQAVLTRLRFGKDFVKRCRHLVQHHMIRYDSEWNRSSVRRFIRRIGEANLDDMFALKAADVLSRDRYDKLDENEELRRRAQAELEDAHALKITDLKIDGDDVMKVLGIPASARVGVILSSLFERVTEDPSLNERDTLLGIVKREYGEDTAG